MKKKAPDLSVSPKNSTRRRFLKQATKAFLGGLPALTLQGFGLAAVSAKLLAQSSSKFMLIYMDEKQSNHLKAYGIAYKGLHAGIEGKWLLGYRGGSFLFPLLANMRLFAAEAEVDFETISLAQFAVIKREILLSNMADIKIEKAPKIAVYTPPNASPWADAVTLVLNYAGIPYDTIYDREVLAGDLKKYDWLHLHHEDFTGQYSKFWASYRNHVWFKQSKASFESEAEKAGFQSVSVHKKAVALAIRDSVDKDGLFLFAMCTATETIDIALAAGKIDIVPQELDASPMDPKALQRLDFTKTFAFENFSLEKSAYINSFSSIDFNQVNNPPRRKEVSDFILFEFSAKLDPVPTLLTQNHRNRISGFYGQTTSFSRDNLKDGVTVLADTINESARYITGKYGKGNFTFYGGHDPEDKQHYVGDKEPNLEFYKNSPGYRLILNNILFPSAKPPPKKT